MGRVLFTRASWVVTTKRRPGRRSGNVWRAAGAECSIGHRSLAFGRRVWIPGALDAHRSGSVQARRGKSSGRARVVFRRQTQPPSVSSRTFGDYGSGVPTRTHACRGRSGQIAPLCGSWAECPRPTRNCRRDAARRLPKKHLPFRPEQCCLPRKDLLPFVRRRRTSPRWRSGILFPKRPKWPSEDYATTVGVTHLARNDQNDVDQRPDPRGLQASRASRPLCRRDLGRTGPGPESACKDARSRVASPDFGEKRSGCWRAVNQARHRFALARPHAEPGVSALRQSRQRKRALFLPRVRCAASCQFVSWLRSLRCAGSGSTRLSNTDTQRDRNADVEEQLPRQEPSQRGWTSRCDQAHRVEGRGPRRGG